MSTKDISPVACMGCDNNVEGFCPADCLCPDTDRWLLALRAEVWMLRSELDKAREALKGAQVICETATSEKKQAEADRDAWRRRAECLESRLASMTAERDALIASLRNNDKCETCMHSLSDGCSAIRNGWRCRYVHPSEEWRGPEEDNE